MKHGAVLYLLAAMYPQVAVLDNMMALKGPPNLSGLASQTDSTTNASDATPTPEIFVCCTLSIAHLKSMMSAWKAEVREDTLCATFLPSLLANRRDGVASNPVTPPHTATRGTLSTKTSPDVPLVEASKHTAGRFMSTETQPQKHRL